MNYLKEAFETIAAHLLRQKIKSKPGGGAMCRYRHYDETSGTMLKCAVGCLIPDEFYDEKAEGIGITAVFPLEGEWMRSTAAHSTWLSSLTQRIMEEREQALCKMLNDSRISATAEMHTLLKMLQSIHDERPPEEWEAALEAFRIETLPLAKADQMSNDEEREFFTPMCGWWIRDMARAEQAKLSGRTGREKIVLALIRTNTPEEDAEDLADPRCGTCECCVMDRLDPDCQVLNIEQAVGPSREKA